MAKKPQIEKFRDKARELGADEDEDAFNAALALVAKHKPEAPIVEAPKGKSKLDKRSS